MCELFGYSSSNPRSINRELKEFYSHSEKHPHGWGLAVFEEKSASFEKEAIKATNSNYLKDRLSEPVEASVALGHIRYATVGVSKRNNSHPFVGKDNSGRRWTLIHNGTIFDGQALNDYYDRQKGDTDSERLLLYLIDSINANPEKDRFEVIDELVLSLAPGNKLNFIIYDGEYLYAHSNFRGSLHALTREDETVISTNPLYDGDWKLLPLNTLVAYKNGKLVKTGTTHSGEYIPDPQQVAELYWAYSHL